MKKILLIASLMLTFSLAFAQIGEVKTEGSFAKIYNENGKYSGHKIYLGSTNSVAGYNSRYVVIKEGNYAKIYNDKGRFTGKKIYLASTGVVKNVTNSAILIKEGAYVKYYNFEGRFTGNKTYEPK